MVSLWSALPKWCVFAITSSFLLNEGCVPVSKMVELPRHLRTAHCHLSKIYNHSMNFDSCVLKFYAEFDTCVLFCTLRHHEYDAWHRHCCLLVMIKWNWAAVSSGWLRACRIMLIHAQISLVQHKVVEKWTQSGCFVIRPCRSIDLESRLIYFSGFPPSWKMLELYFLKFGHSCPLTHPFHFVSYNCPTVWNYVTHTLGSSAVKPRITAASQLVMFWLQSHWIQALPVMVAFILCPPIICSDFPNGNMLLCHNYFDVILLHVGSTNGF